MPVAATTMPAQPASTRARTERASAPAPLVTMATRGHAEASLGRRSTAEPDALRLRRPGPERAQAPFLDAAIGPASPEAKASSRYGWTLRTSSAEWTVPATTTTTPCAPGDVATATASARFCGPSACSDVAGRIAAVSTTGLDGAMTRCRKYAVSSSVSVPCVTTIAATSGRARWLAMRAARRRQVAKSMSLLSSWATCSLSRTRPAGTSRPATSAATPSVAAR